MHAVEWELAGPQISLLAKVVAIANNYDNLCNPANPARALTPHEALCTMKPQQLAKAIFDYLSPRKRITCYFDPESANAAG